MEVGSVLGEGLGDVADRLCCDAYAAEQEDCCEDWLGEFVGVDF